MSREIDWTGERCVPWADAAEVIYEHYHRYSFAADWIKGMDVLDAACGEGYGANILSTSARSVTGIDIDVKSINHARSNYTKPSLHFEVGDLLALEPFGTDRFDAIVCFEALEHVAEHESLMRGIKTVLKPGGLLFVSTPDKAIYNDHNHGGNPFHVKELEAAEFELLLRRSFDNVTILGQSVCSGSLLTRRTISGLPRMVPFTPFSRSGEDWHFRLNDAPVYLLAVASDGPLPDLPTASVLIDDGAELVFEAWRHYEHAKAEVTELRTPASDVLDQQLARAEGLRAQLDLCSAQLEREMVLTSELYAQLAHLRSTLAVRAWAHFTAARDRVLPSGSRMRSAYNQVERKLLGGR